MALFSIKSVSTALNRTVRVPVLFRGISSSVQSTQLQGGPLLMASRCLSQYHHLHSARLSVYQAGHQLWTSDKRNQYNQMQYRRFTEDRKTTALTLIKDLKHLRSSPVPALVLGVAGVIPFAAAPAYIMFSGHFMSSIAFSQVAYGACILSFLGGVRWGLTVSPDESIHPDWFNLGYSVTPSLVAWVGLLLPTSASILVLITGLLGACYMDVTMWGYPPWFKALRFLLTFLAVLSLWTTLMCRLLMRSEKKMDDKKITTEAEVVKEKRSWFRLPWKSSKSTLPPELPSEPIVKTTTKIEEPVQIHPPVSLPVPPIESDVTGATDSTEDKEEAGDTSEGKPPKKELKW